MSPQIPKEETSCAPYYSPHSNSSASSVLVPGWHMMVLWAYDVRKCAKQADSTADGGIFTLRDEAVQTFLLRLPQLRIWKMSVCPVIDGAINSFSLISPSHWTSESRNILPQSSNTMLSFFPVSFAKGLWYNTHHASVLSFSSSLPILTSSHIILKVLLVICLFFLPLCDSLSLPNLLTHFFQLECTRKI